MVSTSKEDRARLTAEAPLPVPESLSRIDLTHENRPAWSAHIVTDAEIRVHDQETVGPH